MAEPPEPSKSEARALVVGPLIGLASYAIVGVPFAAGWVRAFMAGVGFVAGYVWRDLSGVQPVLARMYDQPRKRKWYFRASQGWDDIRLASPRYILRCSRVLAWNGYVVLAVTASLFALDLVSFAALLANANTH